MSRIRILADDLANKIAAGEVVERPASVVKELVENALDAGATRIIIDMENGGARLIRVSDNGSGMSPDEALMAIERHATSKIRENSDLFSIRTLGFRGEALPSIASVSRFTLESREPDADNGIRVEIDGGRLKNVVEAGVPPGTMVLVEHLFHTVPARRKFLKTAATETGHITDVVAAAALGRPDVAFRLNHNGRRLKSWAATADSAVRAADVLGRDAAGALLSVSLASGDVRLSGHIASSRITRSTTTGIHVFINGRHVKDRVVRHAIISGCGSRLMKGRFPVAVLFLDLPPEQVDVNVHPAKHEVRFVRQRAVHQAVSRAVSMALAAADRPAMAPAGFPSSPVFPEQRPPWRPAPAGPAETWRPRPQIAESAPLFPSAQPPASIYQGKIQADPEARPGADPEINADTAAKPVENRGFRFSDLRIIGQFRQTYLICETPPDPDNQKDGGAMILIDQHAAHERIRFEALENVAEGRPIASQRLVVPEVIELSLREAAALAPLLPRLSEMGLEAEDFGGGALKINTVPVLLASGNPAAILRDIAEKTVSLGMDESGQPDALSEALEDARATMACHSSVRANTALASEEISALLTGLDRCRQPSNCPHGRPTWIRWTRTDIEKQFKRIV